MRRLVFQTGILIPMIALALVNDGLLTALVTASLIPIAVFQATVWLYLRSKLSLAVELGYVLPTMRDRVDDKLTLAQGSAAGAFLGMLVALRGIGVIDPVPRWVFLVGISYVMLIIAVPAVGDLGRWRNVWLPALRRGKPQAHVKDD